MIVLRICERKENYDSFVRSTSDLLHGKILNQEKKYLLWTSIMID